MRGLNNFPIRNLAMNLVCLFSVVYYFVCCVLKICLYSATDCQTRVMDVVFVVATSDSTRSVFSNIISFIVSLIEPMRIDTNVRVGLVT